MKRKVLLKNILGFALSFCAVGGIILLLSVASRSSDSGGTVTEKLTQIDFSPENDGDITAENDRFRLSVSSLDAAVTLLDKKTDTLFSSTPDGLYDIEGLKTAAVSELSSVIKIKYADRDSNISEQNSTSAAVKRKTFSVKKIKNGARIEFYFESAGFLIPVELTVTDYGFRAEIISSQIKEKSNLVKLTSVTLLPGFSAGADSDDGYVFIPDGCGAISSFGYSEQRYSARIYGEDCAVEQNTRTLPQSKAYLPVFGIKRNNAAFCAIITNAAARAVVNADGSTAKRPYTTVCAEYVYRENILVSVSQKTFENTQVNMFESKPCSAEKFSVEYRVCDSADYNGMAASYRNYLAEEEGLKALKAKGDALFVDIIGGAVKQQSVLGLPVKRVMPITDFKAAEKTVKALKQGGAEDFSVNYLYWYKNADESGITADLKPERALGGKSVLNAFLSTAEKLGIKAYLGLNFTDMPKSEHGYSKKSASAQTVRKEPVIDYRYKMSTFQKTDKAPFKYLLSPEKITSAAAAACKSFGSFNTAGFSIGTLGNKIYSDLGDRALDRAQSERLWRTALKGLSENEKIIIPNACAYGFSSAYAITDTPLYSGSYLFSQYEIPFYAMALHGSVYLTSPDINGQSDENTAFLKALEAGTALKYAFGFENAGELSDTLADEYSYIDFGLCRTSALGAYEISAEYLTAVSDKKIASHRRLLPDVTETLFENGMGVYVNYGDVPYENGGISVPAKGFSPIGWSLKGEE